jgi:hypothetical protein
MLLTAFQIFRFRSVARGLETILFRSAAQTETATPETKPNLPSLTHFQNFRNIGSKQLRLRFSSATASATQPPPAIHSVALKVAVTIGRPPARHPYQAHHGRHLLCGSYYFSRHWERVVVFGT